MRFVLDDGGRAAAGFKPGYDDCAPRAVAIATGRPYSEVYAAMREELVKRGKPSPVPSFGVADTIIHAVLRNWRFVLAHDMLLSGVPPGRLIAHCRTHCVAVIDHVLHDIGPSADDTPVYALWLPGAR
jgi:hypothetical protein